jgi:imidazolonepropionase-like amidohydrolase
MSCDDELGSIVPGKLADLILVDGKPDEDIRDIRKVEKVIKNGVIHDSVALYAAVGVH